MKKNVMMRTAAVLLVAVLLTTCAIGGTFAKYVTSATDTEQARVAYWGFNSTNATVVLDNLFSKDYTDVKSDDFVIAPGTSGSATITFKYTANTNDSVTAPEVDYTFDVVATGTCAAAIKNNANIKWKLNGADAEDPAGVAADGTWDALLAAISDLGKNDADTNVYKAGELPANFGTSSSFTVGWDWAFTEDDESAMGNADPLDTVSLTITITATQTNS